MIRERQERGRHEPEKREPEVSRFWIREAVNGEEHAVQEKACKTIDTSHPLRTPGCGKDHPSTDHQHNTGRDTEKFEVSRNDVNEHVCRLDEQQDPEGAV